MARIEKEEERRDETIRAVWAALARFGTAATTIERVAEIGGFSKGVIHYYFDSKRALLLAAFEAYLDSYDAEIENRLGKLGREPGAIEALDAVIAACLPPFAPSDIEATELPTLGRGESLTPPYKARLFIQFISLAISDEDFAAVLRKSYERQGAAIMECFSALAPGRDPVASLAASTSLVALIDGFSLHRVLGYVPQGLPEHATLARDFASSSSNSSSIGRGK